MDERTGSVGGQGSAWTDQVDRPAVRGPYARRQVRDLGTEDFLAGEYRPPGPEVMCPTCRAPGEQRLCRAEPSRLRYVLAQISLVHQVCPDGSCSGRGSSAALCGYIELVGYARGTCPRRGST